MNVLVMLEESPEQSPVLAQVNSVRTSRPSGPMSRDVVTLYGVPSHESLALALAAALEGRKAVVPGNEDPETVRQLGVWPGRGAVGDAAWHDRATGQLVTRDLEIPLAVLLETSAKILTDCHQAIGRLLAGLLMPDWPEGSSRALTFSYAPALAGAGVSSEAMLASFREADGVNLYGEDD